MSDAKALAEALRELAESVGNLGDDICHFQSACAEPFSLHRRAFKIAEDARAALAAYDAAPGPAVGELVMTAQWARNRLEAIADESWRGDARDFKRALVGVFADFDEALAKCGSSMPAPLPPAPSVAWEPPADRADGYECLGKTSADRWVHIWWSDNRWHEYGAPYTIRPTAFRPLPPAPAGEDKS